MNLDVDFLINFFNKKSSISSKEEVGEQDTAAPASTVTKWADSYPTKRGKSNMLGKKGEVWVTGVIRGAANQI